MKNLCGPVFATINLKQVAAPQDTEEEVALLDFENPNCVFFEFSERMKQAGINIAGCVKAACVFGSCIAEICYNCNICS
eukprot:SAG11_NODE_802_length_7105_cov_1.831573_2_plen_79_part_00